MVSGAMAKAVSRNASANPSKSEIDARPELGIPDQPHDQFKRPSDLALYEELSLEFRLLHQVPKNRKGLFCALDIELHLEAHFRFVNPLDQALHDYRVSEAGGGRNARFRSLDHLLLHDLDPLRLQNPFRQKLIERPFTGLDRLLQVVRLWGTSRRLLFRH